jgi:hypothetical protein
VISEKAIWHSTEKVLWFIVDSGANLHLVKNEEVVDDKRETEITIQGITDSVQSSVSGRINGQAIPRNSKNIDVNFPATVLPDIPNNLFSVSAAVKRGHEVIHAGDVEHGSHGIILRTSPSTREFIPFVWCSDSNLWWLPIILDSENEGPAEGGTDTFRGRRLGL